MLAAIQAALLLIFPVLVIVAALRDVTSFTIPNWLNGALALAFFPTALALGLDLAQVGLHLAIGLAALALGIAMFALRWVGGGDAKLFAAAALWLGWPAVFSYGVYTAIAGGALAIGLLTMRSMWMRAFVVRSPAWLTRLATPGEAVPYGVAIAAGAMAAYASSTLMTAWGGL